VMALLLWAGGVLGFLAQMPQLRRGHLAGQPDQRRLQFLAEIPSRASHCCARAPDLLPRMRASYVTAGQRLLAEELVPGDVMLLQKVSISRPMVGWCTKPNCGSTSRPSRASRPRAQAAESCPPTGV
jgi:hypothetical protein